MSESPESRARAAGKAGFGPAWHPVHLITAPGRLELLGNHVDYNGGLVLAGAVDQHIAMLVDTAGAQGTISLVPADLGDDTVTIDVESCRDWTTAGGRADPDTYARGVTAALMAAGHAVNDGLRVAIAGSVPLGFGMSSSAALCVGYVFAFTDEALSAVEIVKIAREAEHRAGSPVGAMDQSASVAGGIIRFDGRDTSFTAMRPQLGDLVFVVADSGVSHALGTSSYPTRVKESLVALEVIQELLDDAPPSLGELGPGTWQEVRERFEDSAGVALRKRVDHVVSEVERVRQGEQAALTGDWVTFGVLMTASGASSSTDYEISHPLVDDLVGQILAVDGVLGARMMGGGEGGPALALVQRDAVPHLRQVLADGYFAAHSSHLVGDRLLVANFGQGATRHEIH